MLPVLQFLLILFPFVARESHQTLFTIEHNKNANVVVYEAQLKENSISDDEPVSAYWLMRAEHGQREDLSFFEKRMAFGWDIEKIESRAGMFKMFITAYPKRPVIIQSSEGIAFATMMIAGKRSYLKKIYIYADESKTVPEVQYIDIFGETIADRTPVQERVTP
jgi:hypothetical protein